MCERTLRAKTAWLLRQYLIQRIYKWFSQLTRQYLNAQKSSDEIAFELVAGCDMDLFFDDIHDDFICDCFFTLRYLNHEPPFASTIEEVEYLHECFSGLKTYNLEEKNLYITTRWNEKNKLE